MIDPRILRETKLTQGLLDSDVLALAEIGEALTFGDGEVIVREGDDADRLMIVETGNVDLTLEMAVRSGKRDVRIEELHPGDTLGWSSMIAPFTSTGTARAHDRVSLIAFSRTDIQALIEARPALGATLMTNIATVIGQRMRITQKMWELMLQSMVGNTFD